MHRRSSTDKNKNEVVFVLVFGCESRPRYFFYKIWQAIKTKSYDQDASDPCTLMTAGCSNFRFEIQMNEECRQAEYASINATRLAANGQSDEGYSVG